MKNSFICRNLLFATLFILLSFISLAQKTDTSFQILWYKGKRVSDTSLLTPAGHTIIYSPTHSEVTVAFNEKNDPFAANKNKPSDPAFIDAKPFLDHTISLADQNSAAANNAISSSTYTPGQVPKYIYDYYDEVMNYIKKIDSEKLSGLNPPPPPSTYFDYCFPCDSGRQKAYREDSKKFMENYLGEENRYIDKANQVSNYFQWRRSKKLPFDSSVFIKMAPDMFHACIKIAKRKQTKILAAWQKYKDDASKLKFLTDLLIANMRMNELLTLESEEGFPSFNELSQKVLTTLLDRLEKARRERDYPILLNTAWVHGLLRSAALQETENGPSFSDYIRINQFILTIETEARANGTGPSYSMAKLDSKATLGVLPDSNCRLQWKLIEPDSLKLVYKQEAEEMVLPNGDALQYTGVKVFTSPRPTIDLDFCIDTADQAHFYGFDAGYGKETWTVKSRSMAIPVLLQLYTMCFTDVEQYRKMATDPKAVVTASPYSFLLKEHLKNHEKIIFHSTLDGKALSPQNPYIKYASFKVSIEHIEDN